MSKHHGCDSAEQNTFGSQARFGDNQNQGSDNMRQAVLDMMDSQKSGSQSDWSAAGKHGQRGNKTESGDLEFDNVFDKCSGKKAFERLDKNDDGQLDFAEFSKGFDRHKHGGHKGHAHRSNSESGTESSSGSGSDINSGSDLNSGSGSGSYTPEAPSAPDAPANNPEAPYTPEVPNTPETPTVPDVYQPAQDGGDHGHEVMQYNATNMVGRDKMPVGIIAANYSSLKGDGSNMSVSFLKGLKDEGYGGLQQIYDLPRDRALTQEELNFLARDLKTAQEAGMPLNLRFRYAANAGEPDAPADVILSQMKQLAPVLSANESTIGIMQMGFVGAWGEWNRSTNNPLNDKDFALQQKMYDIYSDALPNTPIAFSHADTLREMFGENSIPNNVMLFNDSIGHQTRSDTTQMDAGQFYQPGDYEWAKNSQVMYTGENQEIGTPQEVLQRIQDLNITSIKLWGPVEDAINASGYRQKIQQALLANASQSGLS